MTFAGTITVRIFKDSARFGRDLKGHITALLTALVILASTALLHADDVKIESFTQTLQETGLGQAESQRIELLLKAVKDIAVQYAINHAKDVSGPSPIGPVTDVLFNSPDIALTSLIIAANDQIKVLTRIGSQRDLTLEEAQALESLTELTARLSELSSDKASEPAADDKGECTSSTEAEVEPEDIPVYVRRENETVADMVCRVKCASNYLTWDESRRQLRSAEIAEDRLSREMETIEERRSGLVDKIAATQTAIDSANALLDELHAKLKDETVQDLRLALADQIADVDDEVAHEVDQHRRSSQSLQGMQADWESVRGKLDASRASLNNAKNAENSSVRTYQNCIRKCVSDGRGSGDEFTVLSDYLNEIGQANDGFTDEQITTTRDLLNSNKSANCDPAPPSIPAIFGEDRTQPSTPETDNDCTPTGMTGSVDCVAEKIGQ